MKRVSAAEIVIEANDGGEDRFVLTKFARSNHGTCFNYKQIVTKGQMVEEGEIIA